MPFANSKTVCGGLQTYRAEKKSLPGVAQTVGRLRGKLLFRAKTEYSGRMFKPAPMIKAVGLALVVATAPACGFGHSVERTKDPSKAMTINLGPNRYIYSITSLSPAPARTSPARPFVSVPPSGAAELGILTVQVDYSGWGNGGLRKTESEFYNELGSLAAELGGDHFHVADKSVDPGGTITAMTVSVVRMSASDAP